MKKKLQQSEAKEVAQGLVAADSTAVRLVVRSVLLLLYACHFWYAFRTITACPHKDEVFKNLIGFGGRWKFLTVVNEVSFFISFTFYKGIYLFDCLFLFTGIYNRSYSDWHNLIN